MTVLRASAAGVGTAAFQAVVSGILPSTENEARLKVESLSAPGRMPDATTWKAALPTPAARPFPDLG